jgi:multiple antibiotic resistance protein
MADCFRFFIQYFTRLFIIISPLATIALYVAMTAPFPVKERLRVARTGSIVAYCAMIFFALTGRSLFEFLGITMGAFYIAGGAIIFLVGVMMLGSDGDEGMESDAAKVEKSKGGKIDIAITPFGIPMICGPCCITGTITFQHEAVGVMQYISGLLAVTAVSVALYVVLIGCAHGAKWLTKPVLKLSYKLSGLILAALAVQMIVTGLRHEELQVLAPMKQHSDVVATETCRCQCVSCHCDPCLCQRHAGLQVLAPMKQHSDVVATEQCQCESCHCDPCLCRSHAKICQCQCESCHCDPCSCQRHAE